jgi:hypothetical protein
MAELQVSRLQIAVALAGVGTFGGRNGSAAFVARLLVFRSPFGRL